MESLVTDGGDTVRNLIYVSFIEDIDQDAAIVPLCGPQLTNAWQDYWRAPFGTNPVRD